MERLLLDTHAFLWWLADDPRLGESVRKRIAEPANPVFVSAATGWEIGIKKALGKLQAPDDRDSVVEGLVLVTRDPNIKAYGIRTHDAEA